MAKIYRYTAGFENSSDPFPWQKTLISAKPTSANELYAEIINCFELAGWTAYRYLDQATLKSAVLFSTGENGRERIYGRVRVNGTQLFVYVGVFGDSGGLWGAGTHDTLSCVCDPTDNATYGYASVPNARTYEMQAFGNKDFMWINWVSGAGTTDRGTMHIGIPKREGYSSGSNMFISEDASPGRYVELKVGADNPILFGYRRGDLIQAVTQNRTPHAETMQVIDVTASSLIVSTVKQALPAGTVVGSQPMPVIGCLVDQFELNYSSFPTRYRWGTALALGDVNSTEEVVRDPLHFSPRQIFSGGLGSPAKNTNRYSLRAHNASVADMVLGEIQGIYDFSGVVTYLPADYGIDKKANPTRYYVVMKSFNAGSWAWMLGPMPTL